MSPASCWNLLDPAAGSCFGGGFAPLAAGHAGEESRRQHNHQHHQHNHRNGGFCRRRWDGFQPLPPTGDSGKNNSTRKKKAAGSCCGGGFAALAMCAPPPLAARHGRRAAGLRASGLRTSGLSGCSAASAATVDPAAAAAAINLDSRPVPERRILPLLLLEPSNPTTNVSRGTTWTADPCRNGGSCRCCCWSPRTRPQMFHVEQPGQPTRAGTEDSVVGLLGYLNVP